MLLRSACSLMMANFSVVVLLGRHLRLGFRASSPCLVSSQILISSLTIFKKSKGFGFMTFFNQETVTHVLRDQHSLNARLLVLHKPGRVSSFLVGCWFWVLSQEVVAQVLGGQHSLNERLQVLGKVGRKSFLLGHWFWGPLSLGKGFSGDTTFNPPTKT